MKDGRVTILYNDAGLSVIIIAQRLRATPSYVSSPGHARSRTLSIGIGASESVT